MTTERKNFIHLFPAESLQDGKLWCSSQVGDVDLCLSTTSFIESCSNKYYSISDSPLNYKIVLSEWSSIRTSCELISRILPQDKEELQELQNEVQENLILAKEILEKEMTAFGLDEKSIYEQVEEGESLDESLQFVISQVQEYAWYMALTHFPLVLTFAKSSQRWQEMSSADRSDYFQENLIAAWELACRWDREKGDYSTYLASAQTRIADRRQMDKEDIPRGVHGRYILPYVQAAKLLRETEYSGDLYMTEVLALMIYDKKTGRLDYSDSEVLEALDEYYTKLTQWVMENENSKLHWIRPYKHFKTVMRKRLKTMRTVLALNRPISFDHISKVPYRSEDSGEMEEQELPLFSMIADERDLQVSCEKKDAFERLKEAIKQELTERQQLVIKQRFGIDSPVQTLKAIGRQLKCTPENVRQIEARAIKILREQKVWRTYMYTWFDRLLD